MRETGRPIAAPSANRSGRVSPTEAAHVAEELGDHVALILDGGRTPVGLESTVLDLSGEAAVLLRPGGVMLEQLTEFLGPIAPIAISSAAEPRSPGYAAEPLCACIAIAPRGDRGPPGGSSAGLRPGRPGGFCRGIMARRTRDLAEAAANLFAMLRRLDRPAFTGIAVMPIPERGLGRAINDRLRRAAAPRQD